MSTVDPDVELPSLGPALELMRRLWRVSHEYERLSARMASAMGLTAQQRTTLRIVGRFPSITAGRLSALLCVDAATISTTLKRLEGRGLVRRTRDRSDGRRVVIALTPRGRALDVPAEGTVEAAIARVVSRVPARDIDATDRVLDALARSLADEGSAATTALPKRAPTRKRSR